MNRRPAIATSILMACLCVAYQAATSSTPVSRSPDRTLTPIQAVAITSQNKIFAGTFGLGMFSSSDGGRTWSAANADLSNQNVLAVTARNKGAIFVGTFGGGVYRSDNNDGSRWVQVNAGLNSKEVTCLQTGEDGNVYAGTSTGQIFHSSDNGESWMYIGDLGEFITTLAIAGNENILAGTSRGIYRTHNAGRTWARGNPGMTCHDVWSLAVDQHGNVFAGTNGGGVYLSLDAGETWAQINAGLKCKNVGSVAVCVTGKVFVGTTDGVFVSADEGKSWSSFVSNGPDSVVRCLTVGLNGQLLVGSHWIDIFSSNPVQPLPEDGV